MYARLDLSANTPSWLFWMQVVHLVTNTSPTIFTGTILNNYFANTSTVIDSTPSGWSFVGSSTGQYDTPAEFYQRLGDGNPHTEFAYYRNNNDNWNLTVGAPVSANTSRTKYVNFNHTLLEAGSNANGYMGCMSLCSFANQSTVVDQTWFHTSPSSNPPAENSSSGNFSFIAGKSFHILCNNSHITIVDDNVGFEGVWDSQGSDHHEYYNTPATTIVMAGNTLYQLANTGAINAADYMEAGGPHSNAAAQFYSPFAMGVDIANSSNNYVFPVKLFNYSQDSNTSIQTNGAFRKTMNTPSLYPSYSDPYPVTRLANNAIRTQIVPITYNIGYGYPTQVVTGTSPVYYASANVGVSGDTIDINGEEYVYLNAGRISLCVKSS
jgi:hypothetical protein